MKIPDVIKEAARELRTNMTSAEQKLWEHIRRDISGFRFLRQKPLYVFTEDSGQDRFIIPDFYCYEKKLVLEIDGNIHETSDIYKLDREKEKLLKSQGIEVMRITNDEISTDIEKIIQKITTKLS
jgi:very-short-patch-repair endonuclease